MVLYIDVQSQPSGSVGIVTQKTEGDENGVRESADERPTDRERYLLWEAMRNGGNICMYTGLGQVPGDLIIVIGDCSTERLLTHESRLEDFEMLEHLEKLGHIERVSRVKFEVTEAGKAKAEKYKF